MTEEELVNIKRHIDKINLALQSSRIFFERNSEANAALHISGRVLYSPIVTTINEAEESLRYLKDIVENNE